MRDLFEEYGFSILAIVGGLMVLLIIFETISEPDGYFAQVALKYTESLIK